MAVRKLETYERDLMEPGDVDRVRAQLYDSGWTPEFTLHEERMVDRATVIHWWDDGERNSNRKISLAPYRDYMGDLYSATSSNKETVFDMKKLKEAMNLLENINKPNEFISEDEFKV